MQMVTRAALTQSGPRKRECKLWRISQRSSIAAKLQQGFSSSVCTQRCDQRLPLLCFVFGVERQPAALWYLNVKRHQVVFFCTNNRGGVAKLFQSFKNSSLSFCDVLAGLFLAGHRLQILAGTASVGAAAILICCWAHTH